MSLKGELLQGAPSGPRNIVSNVWKKGAIKAGKVVAGAAGQVVLQAAMQSCAIM